jgi:hypothetical protein
MSVLKKMKLNLHDETISILTAYLDIEKKTSTLLVTHLFTFSCDRLKATFDRLDAAPGAT